MKKSQLAAVLFPLLVCHGLEAADEPLTRDRPPANAPVGAAASVCDLRGEDLIRSAERPSVRQSALFAPAAQRARAVPCGGLSWSFDLATLAMMQARDEEADANDAIDATSFGHRASLLAAQEQPAPRRPSREERPKEVVPTPAEAQPAEGQPAQPPAGEGAKEGAEEAAPTAEDKLLDHFKPLHKLPKVQDRWGIRPPEYGVNEEISPLNPFRQNVLKGDFPIIGEDIFLTMNFTNRTLNEYRRVPTPTGITGPEPGKEEFFGEGDQYVLQNYAIVDADLFKGQQAFKPVDWRIRAALAYNVTYLAVRETGVVNINVDDGRNRTSDFVALQTALVEKHLFDLTDRYDFVSVEAGILPFRSDFRGFVFDDVNLGVRFLGNYDENKWQYNLVFFDLLEKDTNSELNRFRDRDQYVVIANVFRQDWPVLGFIQSFSFHYNYDDDSVYFNRNGFLVRPAPVGFARPHKIESVYFGAAGEGHFDRVNVTYAFYQALGRDSDNPFAARDVDINAQLAALELSYDIDWARLRAFSFFTSGDRDARDGSGEGFDAIVDSPAFAGGEASFFNRQEIRLLGVALTQRLSPIPDLSAAKFEGQSNFVNPGILLIGGALDIEIAPTARCMLGGSYFRFNEVNSLETFIEIPDVDKDLGAEVFFAIQWRPLLTNNVIINAGFSPFFPGDGFKRLFQRSETLYSAFVDLILTW
jgi:hypothetical protein